MLLQESINNIRYLIAKNETSEAIILLNTMLKSSPKLNEAILQSAQHHDIMQQIRIGVLDEYQAKISKNQIRKRILDLLLEIEEQHIKSEFSLPINDEYDTITKKIQTNRGIGTSEMLKGKSSSDLDFDELERFFTKTRTLRRFTDSNSTVDNLTIHQKLLKLGLAENGHLYKGTFLCLGQINQIESINHSAAESKFMVFKGTTRINFLVLETVRGNLVQQYEKMMLLMQKHIPLRRDVYKSEDFYAIPFIAFKELLANAFIHRSYEANIQTAIQVELFDDRLEIKSPGLFPEFVDLDNVEMSYIINPSIAAIFFLYGHIEKSGTGINRAKAVLAEQGMKPPVLYQNALQKYVKLTIFI
jgi:predicted HTH transcriptional regulator